MNDKGRKQKHNRSRVFLALPFFVQGHNQNKKLCTAQSRASGQWQELEQEQGIRGLNWLLTVSVHTCLPVPPALFFCHY